MCRFFGQNVTQPAVKILFQYKICPFQENSTNLATSVRPCVFSLFWQFLLTSFPTSSLQFMHVTTQSTLSPQTHWTNVAVVLVFVFVILRGVMVRDAVRIVPLIRPRPLLSIFCPIHYLLILLSFDAATQQTQSFTLSGAIFRPKGFRQIWDSHVGIAEVSFFQDATFCSLESIYDVSKELNTPKRLKPLARQNVISYKSIFSHKFLPTMSDFDLAASLLYIW